MVTLKLLIIFQIFFCTPLHVLTVPDHFSLQGEFPTWIKARDRMMLETSNVKNIDVVVALDGTEDYRKVMDAIFSAPKRDGMDATVISGNLSSRRNNLTSYYTATFAVDGIGFIAKYISFKNTAGPKNNQAVALRSSSDKSVFYRCGIFGYQDSLYAHSQRQFYRECRISGTVDFIFGYAAAVFQNCNILVKKGTPGQSNTITAQGGMHDSTKPFGFSFQFCKISADHDLLPVVKSTQTYLGRPWKDHSKTIFMETYITNVLSAQG
ncbi:pectinesterase/pectinesterase inhibitor PPE8B, partial [Trifolium medium]|nr:pectinesterase/pectinesterase inhibitor PPE8B [Trifolium medium]